MSTINPQTSLVLLFSSLTVAAVAQAEVIELSPIEVTAPKKLEDAQATSGAHASLSEAEIEKSRVFNVNEALRKLPGVNVKDEEGFGIRPNIGIRGMNPFRSTKTLFLEDGLPLNYAPYGDNDIYYHPPIERYSRIDVYKGADLTLYGPQTLSGAINYTTPNPPSKPGGFATFTGGSRDYLMGHLRYGGLYKKFGGIADYIHKEGSGARDNTFAKLDDVNVKGIVDIDQNNSLIFRGDFYQEESQSTFGLTEAEFRKLGRFYNPFKNDTFETRRWATSATHELRFNDSVSLNTSFYWSHFNRDWWRQMNQQPTDTQCDKQGGYPTFRSERMRGIAVNVDECNFTRGRLRHYETWGVTPNLHAEYQLFGINNILDAGFRAHFENQYRKTEDGNRPDARSGKIIENNDRFADAYAGYIQNQFIIDQFTITPGARIESVNYQRRNNLLHKEGQSSLTEVLPSFALSYKPLSNTTLFFGMHRGFAPPRVEDSVYNDGNPVEIGAEKSWNYELGIRTKPAKGIQTDLTYFHNHYQTLTVLGTVGGNDTPVAQGKALYEGVEWSGRVDAGELFDWTHNPYVQMAYTWLPTAETLSAFRCLPLSDGRIPGNCPNGYVYGSRPGKRTPYAPEHLLTASVGYSHPTGIDLHLETVFVADQFADFMNLNNGSEHPNGTNSNEALSGQYGRIQDYVIVNFAGSYQIHPKLNVFVTVKNLFDHVYIVDRVRGILPGSPRLVQAGFKYDF